ncbi:cellulose binding domain-containing protein [Kutzneria chonburiensis]|uniref:Cellulose binding domain-containing protein n=1 Tax=Kutzneria chonburiensis TaxID=1483604 RepID=A0ABV6MP39_9PSEU
MISLTARRFRLITAVAVLGAGLLAAGPAAADPGSVTVTVNARAGLATVSDTAVGVNHAVWDSELGTNTVADLYAKAGVGMMRYPGGSYGDIYHWKDNTAPGGYVAPNTDFDTFMGGVHRAGAQPIIIADYGSGTPQEAADWVRYANVTKGYGAKYWEIGNELYGNGHYGANWEADQHADKSPTAYAQGVVAYADAMKAVDPTIKVGAVLTTPANWPDGLVGSGDSATWNETVLSIAASHIDFVILHWYPSGATAADELSRPDQVTDMLYLVRQEIDRHSGGRDIGIALTETNTAVGMDTQPGALFAAETYASLLANGVFTVDWWDTHNGPTTVSTVAGQTDYGDSGLLSSGGCVNGTCEPAVNTPFAPYHALSMLGSFARPGDQFVRAGSDQPTVNAYAVRRANGDLALLLVNKDPDNAHTIAVNYAGYTPSPAVPTVSTFTNGASAVTTTSAGTATSQTLPPYSLTTVLLHPAATNAQPAPPGQPSAGTVTDRTATISWPSSGTGLKYEVYRQVGAVSEELGETTGTSLDVANLNPGTRYTVNVLARNGSGAVSWSSPPLTFTTTAPAHSTCSVRYADANDWASGFVGSVDITNTGSAPLDGWTLAFTWPTPYQQVSSGWNGTWTQQGTTVVVTGTGQLAPNAKVNTGFVAGYTGPNVTPIAFTLNGTVCATG